MSSLSTGWFQHWYFEFTREQSKLKQIWVSRAFLPSGYENILITSMSTLTKYLQHQRFPTSRIFPAIYQANSPASIHNTHLYHVFIPLDTKNQMRNQYLVFQLAESPVHYVYLTLGAESGIYLTLPLQPNLRHHNETRCNSAPKSPTTTQNCTAQKSPTRETSHAEHIFSPITP